MRKRAYRMAGETLAQAEKSIGTTMHVAVRDFYRGLDLSTAQAIRDPNKSDTEAVELVTAIRRGRAVDVALVAGSAVAGVAAGAFFQHATGNPEMAGVSPIAALGAVPAIAGLVAPVGLTGRAVLTTGGVSYAAGATLYNMIAPRAAGPQGGQP